MKPLTDRLVRSLDLTKAIEVEANTERNLLPGDFSWEKILAGRQRFTRWVTSLLKAGFNPSEQQIVSIRKLQGTRPAPIWGPVERVVYRALTESVLGADFVLDRSADAYIRFVKAPVEYSETLQAKDKGSSTSLFFFLQSDIKYVVKSDITAFYQYIDHAVLARDLVVRGAEYDCIEALMSLLREVLGRTYGLPQLLDASDMLSEVYVDKLERDMLRKGWNIWRYNDDFRIACREYEDTLHAVEQLDVAAREIGLVISESKTLTYRFTNYMIDSLNLELSPGQESLSLEDVEAAVGDYTDDFSENTDSAAELIQSATASNSGDDDNAINIRRITPVGLRLLRRALSSLEQASDSRALDHILPLAIYVPALFPSLMRYLVKLHSTDSAAVVTTVDAVVENASMNEWQHQWLIQIIQELNLLASGSGGRVNDRIKWVTSLCERASSKVTTAYACRTLAAVSLISLDDLTRVYENSPTALLPWYLHAFDSLLSQATDEAIVKRINSLRKTSPLHGLLLGAA